MGECRSTCAMKCNELRCWCARRVPGGGHAHMAGGARSGSHRGEGRRGRVDPRFCTGHAAGNTWRRVLGLGLAFL